MALLTQGGEILDGAAIDFRVLTADDPIGRYLIAGEMKLDRYERSATFRGLRLELTQMESRLLECLIRNAPRTVAKDVLQYRLWGDGAKISNALAVLVNQLRRKLGAETIATHAGVGYRLEKLS